MIFMLGWLAGMRIGEIAALRVRDVVAQDNQVRTEIQLSADQTKGRQGRAVLLNKQLQSEIALYLASGEATALPEQPLLQTRSGKQFSANGLCVHMLRHRRPVTTGHTHAP